MLGCARNERSDFVEPTIMKWVRPNRESDALQGDRDYVQFKDSRGKDGSRSSSIGFSRV